MGDSGRGDRVVVPVRRHIDDGAVRVAATVARRADLRVELVDLSTVDIRAYALWSGACLLCTALPAHHLGRRPALPSLLGVVPVLTVGPRCDPGWADCRRLVVAIDGPRSATLVDTAAWLGRRLGAELELVEVLAPTEAGGQVLDVPEVALLRCVARRVVPPPESFDVLHDRRADDGVLRFVGRDTATVIVLGCGRGWHRHRRVPGRVVRRARCPVLLVPT